MVQVPLLGKPVKVTLPVADVQVISVLEAIVGATGVGNIAPPLKVKLAEVAKQPDALVALMV